MSMSEAYQKHTRSMQETCQKITRSMPEAYQKHSKNTPEACQKHTRNIPETCQKLARNILNCRTHAISMPDTLYVRGNSNCQNLARSMLENSKSMPEDSQDFQKSTRSMIVYCRKHNKCVQVPVWRLKCGSKLSAP